MHDGNCYYSPTVNANVNSQFILRVLVKISMANVQQQRQRGRRS